MKHPMQKQHIDDKGVTVKLHNVGIPEENLEWVDLAGFRERGDPKINLSEVPFGSVVVTSTQIGNTNELYYIGYVCQIRKGTGAFGSDVVLIRHPDGKLTRHENQFFWVLDDSDAKTVLLHSETKPADEFIKETGKLTYGYGGGKEEETGYIIK